MSKTLNKSSKSKTEKVISKLSNATLYTWNKWLAIVYALQGVAILLLSTVKIFPLTINYLTVDNLASEAAGSQVLTLATRTLFELNIAHLLAIILFVAAVIHGLAAWKGRKLYESDLNRSVNRMRWIGGAANAGLVLVAIAMLAGVTDLASLLMIMIPCIVANLIGLFVDTYNSDKFKIGRLAPATAVVAGSAPWIAVGAYLLGAALYDGQVPKFVCWIFISLFILFGFMIFNAWKQYKKQGKWADYLYGERLCIVLSFIAITALTWQVFFGALRP